jgi:hypothetical protein
VTLLSPSLSASEKAAGLLSSILLSSSPQSSDENKVALLPTDPKDELDRAFTSRVPGLSRSWQSVSVVCPVSQSILHFCSLSGKENDGNNNTTPFALLSITESVNTSGHENLQDNIVSSIRQCRNLLAEQFQQSSSTSRNLKMNLKNLVGSPLTPTDLLQEMDGLPLLSFDLKGTTSMESSPNQSTLELTKSSSSPFLKEIVVPFFDYAEYTDGSNLLSRLSQANTRRPVVGLYQWPFSSTTCIRPLPTAAEDKQLPPPSLIFHFTSSAHDMTAIALRHDFQTARIGYSGGMDHGQTMLLHRDLPGLDIRLCPRTTVSSAFSEAQESLLAGSLPELQNNNILLAGGEQAVEDDRIGKGDCWVEVRANLRRPTGYLGRSRKTAPLKRANIPDLPYE